MKIVFLSNCFNHHQEEFCNRLYELLGDNFKFIAHLPVSAERLTLGWKDINKKHPYIIRFYDEKEEYIISLCDNADVVIIGSFPFEYIKNRMRDNKLTFVYTERLFKKPSIKHLLPNFNKMICKNHIRYRNKNLYYLCAGAYVAKDINIYIHRKDKFFKWGYFPNSVIYDNIDDVISNKAPNSILWVGRFIDWKHPEMMINLAEKLKQSGKEFKITFVGNGASLDDMKNMAEKKNVASYIDFVGGVDTDEVRNYMLKSRILISTSDRQEGWGAVINEAMNSACAVIANKAIGAAPYLIENNISGYTFKNFSQMLKITENLLDDDTLTRRIGTNAYNTIIKEWNGKNAADQLINLIDVLSGKENLFRKSGVCSKAL